MAKLEVCDGEAILISLPKGEEEPWELWFQTMADGLISTSSSIFSIHFLLAFKSRSTVCPVVMGYGFAPVAIRERSLFMTRGGGGIEGGVNFFSKCHLILC